MEHSYTNSIMYGPWLASNHDPPDLCLTSNWDTGEHLYTQSQRVKNLKHTGQKSQYPSIVHKKNY
jgi:hypothetical protein